MADTKITALTALTAADPANDVLPIVDVSDTTMAASGTTKKISVNNILGCSGTATLASATITGDLTVDTSTLKVDSANNRVGVGTASPTSALDVVGSAIVSSQIRCSSLDTGTTTGDLYLFTSNRLSQTAAPTIECQNNSKPLIINHTGSQSMLFGIGSSLQMTLNSTGLGVGGSPNNKLTVNGTASTWNKGAYIIYSDSGSTYIGGLGNGGSIFGSGTDNDIGITTGGATNLRLGTNNTERLRIDSSGNVGIGVTPAGTGGCLQLSSGITFPATQVASSDPNTLDDYEEGSWNPVVADASTGGNTGTCTINSAKYVKIGRQVSVQCDISGITTTGMTAGNVFFIRGLPFTSVQGGDGNFYTYRVGRDAATVSASAHVSDASSVIAFFLYTTNSATTDKTILVSNIVSTTSQLILSVTYFV